MLYQKDGAHWQLKAELTIIKLAVEKYLQNFDPNRLISHSFKAEKNQILTAIIFIIK